jgi:predicted RNase H-like nuclease (RuvC/YqgF family)
MSYKTYSDKLGQVLKACKSQNINASIKKIQDDILVGTDINCIINNLHKYI